MTTTQTRPTAPAPERRAGELTFRELLRWTWRQLTSMRTALVLLLMLALAAVPGSVIPQERVDSLKTGEWQDRHHTLTPIYQRLDLFNVYGSPWFAAIYLLLMVSLVGCIVPRTFVYVRGIRAQPPVAPRHLSRLRDSAAYGTHEPPEVVLARARGLLKRRRYRLRVRVEADEFVSAERGYLREVGNLLFHLAVLVVLVGFGIGSLFGYKGGVILVTGDQFSNTPTQYDDFLPGQLFTASMLDDFRFTVDHFAVDWLDSGPRAGMARGFDASMHYNVGDGPTKHYDLKVNHPLTIGHTELFLIGQGYAPWITIRDGTGQSIYSGPSVFLPEGPDLFSFGVVKPPDSPTGQLGLQGFFYPNYADIDGTPVNLSGNDLHPELTLSVYTGDLGMDTGASQSIYVLDTKNATEVKGADGKPLRLNLFKGQTAQLPDGLGSITFDKVVPWQRIQISQTPGKRIALAGVLLALLGVLGSLFVRSRRVWVRAFATDGGTVVEVAVLDRSGGADVTAVLSDVVAALQSGPPRPEEEKPS